MGHTTVAASAVVSAFMAGLASGGFAASTFLKRFSGKNALFVYGLIELGIGLAGLLTKIVLSNIDALPLSHSISAQPVFLFVIPFLILLLPTFLMGLTYPLLVDWFRNEKSTSVLYGINTLGAVMGVFSAGFIFIPKMGLSASFMIAASINVVAGVIAIAISRRAAHNGDVVVFPPHAATTPAWSRVTPLLMSVFFLTGLASITAEVAWTRAFALLIGSSTYAFTIMLVTFLVAIALGALAFQVLQGYIKPNFSLLSAVLFLTSFAILVYLPFFNQLNYFYVRIFPLVLENQFLMDATRFLLCAVVMFFPAFLMGLIFPWILNLLIEENPRRDSTVGVAVGVNTTGAIAGGALSGLWLIPAIGTENTLLACVWIYGAAAFALLLGFAAPTSRRTLAAIVSLGIIALGASVRPPWDPLVMSSGVFIYAQDYYHRKNYQEFQMDTHQNELLFYKDGVACTVSVHQTPAGGRFLRVNGKTDASTGQDMHTQVLLGVLPGLFHPRRPETSLVLGLGSGVTAGALSTFSSMKKIDCVEIEPAVAEALHFFSPINHSIRSNPILKIHYNDGRRHLKVSAEKYDIIASEPSNPWIAGVSNLYTKEAFDLAKARLAPNGIFCQWFHSYSMSLDDFQLIMRTFAASFPHVMLLTSGDKDFFFLGSNEPWQIDYGKVQAGIDANPDLQLDLLMLGLNHPFTLISSSYLLEDDGFRAMAGEGPLHRDDRPTLEFTSPRNLYRNLSQFVDAKITEHKKESLPSSLSGFNPTKKELAFLHNLTGEAYLRQKNLAGAEAEFGKAMQLDNSSARTWANKGRASNLRMQHFQAEKEYRKAISLDGKYALPWFYLGMLYFEQEQEDQALEYLMEGHKRAPTDPMGSLQIASMLMRKGRNNEARVIIEKALQQPILNRGLYQNLEHLLINLKQKSPAP